MTVNGGHSTGLFFVYGWRGGRGPFYVDGAGSAAEAIAKALAGLRSWKRTVAKDVRTGKVVGEFSNESNQRCRRRSNGGAEIPGWHGRSAEIRRP
jgi:hypothetical protein